MGGNVHPSVRTKHRVVVGRGGFERKDKEARERAGEGSQARTR